VHPRSDHALWPRIFLTRILGSVGS
jgi:hypothetical protein